MNNSSLADQSWLENSKKGIFKGNEYLMYDIVENSTMPVYKFSNNDKDSLTQKELKVFRDWYFSIVECKDFSVDFKSIFDCWIDKVQLQSNIKLLDKYKNVIYDTLTLHRSLDTEVQSLMKKSYDNLKNINIMTSEL